MRAFTPSEVFSAAKSAGFDVVMIMPAPGSVSDQEGLATIGISDYYFWVVLEAK
jgi:hypothetical protein